LNESTFNEKRLQATPMATQKLEEGIASFCADAVKIEQLLKAPESHHQLSAHFFFHLNLQAKSPCLMLILTLMPP
jgi:hypothetical protein